MGDVSGRELLQVGRIDKPHGLKGEVVVTLTTTEAARVAVGSVLVVGDRPMAVVASKPLQHRWIVAFEGVGRREEAEALAGAVLRAEPLEDDDPEALWVHELVGAAVVEADGTERGVVEAVQDNPASDLLVLDSGALVPLRFVTGRDADGRVVVEVPAGLFELLDD
jgi:16S rRNA processing protein RimM